MLGQTIPLSKTILEVVTSFYGSVESFVYVFISKFCRTSLFESLKAFFFGRGLQFCGLHVVWVARIALVTLGANQYHRFVADRGDNLSAPLVHIGKRLSFIQGEAHHEAVSFVVAGWSSRSENAVAWSVVDLKADWVPVVLPLSRVHIEHGGLIRLGERFFLESSDQGRFSHCSVAHQHYFNWLGTGVLGSWLSFFVYLVLFRLGWKTSHCFYEL